MSFWGGPLGIILTVLTEVRRLTHCERHHSLAGILGCSSEDKELCPHVYTFVNLFPDYGCELARGFKLLPATSTPDWNGLDPGM